MLGAHVAAALALAVHCAPATPAGSALPSCLPWAMPWPSGAAHDVGLLLRPTRDTPAARFPRALPRCSTRRVNGGGRDRVTCGRGSDIVYADRRDRVARDCERLRGCLRRRLAAPTIEEMRALPASPPGRSPG